MHRHDDNILKITKINEEQQSSYIRYLSRMTSDLRLEIFSNQKKIFHALREKYKNEISLNLLSYCALIKTIETAVKERSQLNNKNFDNLSIEEIRKVSSTKAKLFISKQHRIQSKSEKLIGYWALVRTLKIDEGYSFRHIAGYLEKYHKLKIAHSTISTQWNKIEKDQK